MRRHGLAGKWRIGLLAAATVCHADSGAAQARDPSTVRIAPGEAWTYASRSLDSNSTLVIEAIEPDNPRDVHVCLRGVVLRGQGAIPDTSLDHLVLSGYMLRKSLRKRVASGLTPGCEAGHAAWEATRPYPLVYIASLRGVIGALERRRWPVQPDTLPEPRRCTLVSTPAEPDSSLARRCAEEFIAVNGYTDAAVVDSTRVAAETIQFGSLEDILDQRHNTLVARAYSSSCTDRECSVAFRYRGHSSPCAMRLVTMDAHFDHLRMQHQDVMSSKAAASGKCD